MFGLHSLNTGWKIIRIGDLKRWRLDPARTDLTADGKVVPVGADAILSALPAVNEIVAVDLSIAGEDAVIPASSKDNITIPGEDTVLTTTGANNILLRPIADDIRFWRTYQSTDQPSWRWTRRWLTTWPWWWWLSERRSRQSDEQRCSNEECAHQK